jgi:hypothetical protein
LAKSAYDSDGTDERFLDERGIDVIALHHKKVRQQITRTEGTFVATIVDGESIACLLGFKTSGDWFCAGSTMLTTSGVCCSSVVQLYYSVYFEMTSNFFVNRKRL